MVHYVWHVQRQNWAWVLTQESSLPPLTLMTLFDHPPLMHLPPSKRENTNQYYTNKFLKWQNPDEDSIPLRFSNCFPNLKIGRKYLTCEKSRYLSDPMQLF